MFNKKRESIRLEKLEKTVEANFLSEKLKEAGFHKLAVYDQTFVSSVVSYSDFRFVSVVIAREILNLNKEGHLRP